jgi:hypothetical protein
LGKSSTYYNGENTDVELPFKFSATTLQYPLSLPRTIASSIIIDEDIVDNNRAIAFYQT